MKRRLSTRARLERLEKALKNGVLSHGQAFIEMGLFDGERHVVVTDAAHCHFRELPGPGPQLADFGEFSLVVYMTPAEMEIPCD
jgi:hypothetical protein